MRIASLSATQIPVGLSAIVRVTASNYQMAHTLKIMSGSGTLYVSPVPPALSGSSAAALITAGYPLSSGEVLAIGGPATFYLSAAGATMTVGLVLGFSGGATTI